MDMFAKGFLGTRAPIFMDITTLIVALLPLLVAIAIVFIKYDKLKTHAFLQLLIYIVSVVVVGYFEVGVRVGGGYKALSIGSSVSHNYMLYVLIFHIIVATLSLVIWTYTLFHGLKILKSRNFERGVVNRHKKLGVISYIGITLTALTGIWVYLLMFVY